MDFERKYIWDTNQFENKNIIVPQYDLPWEYKSSSYEFDYECEQMEYVNRFFPNLSSAQNYVKKNEISKISALNFPLGDKQEYMANSRLLDFLFILDDFIYESCKYEMDYVDNLMDRNSKKHDIIGIEIWKLFDEYYKFGKKESVDLLIRDLEYWSRSAIKTNKSMVLNTSFLIEEYFNTRHGDFGMTITASSCTSTLNVEKDIRESKQFKKFFKYFELCNLMINDSGFFKMESKDELLTNFCKIRAIQVGSIEKSFEYCIGLLKTYATKMEKYSNLLEKQFPNHLDLKKYIYTLKIFTAGHKKGYGYANRYN